MHRLTLALAGTLLAMRAVHAQDPGRIPLDTFSLPNGLQVVLAEDHSAQVVAVDMWYHVGSRNEVPGRTGFAHLFEHMMFEGSAHVPKGEHLKLVSHAGGQLNGSTTEDRTEYWDVLPSNRLNLGLWLEADRMRSLAVTDSTFHNQREAVKEERRLRVDNQPYGRTLFEETYAAFDPKTCFPYSHSVIGSMDDLNAAQTADVQAFFHQYYAPDNATLVVTGDFVPAEARKLITDYFGGIPEAAPVPPVVCNQSFSPGAQRKVMEDDKATLPAAFQVYRVPAYDNADYPALELLATILGQGESSRLNRALTRESKSAVATQVLLNPFGPRRGPGIFLAFAIANQGVPVDTVDAQLAAQIAKLGTEGITDAELTKARNSYRADAIFERQTAFGRAELLERDALFLGSPEAADNDIDRYMKVTTDDIKRVASTYLVPNNSLTLIVTAGAK